MIVLPLILAIATNNFILNESIYYEQPSVHFTNEFLVEALVNDGTIDSVKQFSTVANINKRFANKLTNPRLSVKAVNINDDLRSDRLDIEFKFFHLNTESIKSMNILFYLQYYVGNEINTQFKTLVYKSLNAASGGNIAFATMKGELNLLQKNPMAEGTIKRELYNSKLEDDYFTYGIRGLLDRYNMRNQTTEYNAEPIISSYGSTTETKVVMSVVVPNYESILYTASVLEIVKYAWIQYLALLIPIYFLLYVWLYGFIVKSNVLD